MLEPIFTQLQGLLYRSAFEDLRTLLSELSNSSYPGGPSLKARPSAFDEMILAAAQRHDLEPGLLKAVVQAESNFALTAISHAGAKGLMQLMDATAQQLGVVNSFDPEENIDGGAQFLRQLLDRYNGNEALALAAYNAGPGAVDRWGGIPPYLETQTYVPRVLDLRNQYRSWSA